MSMAAGEYVSVSSQSDTERADLAREKQELKQDRASEMEELARIYVRRGLELLLARQVARQLMAKDALGAHARDELGLGHKHGTPCSGRNGFGGKFSVGAAAPLALVLFSPLKWLVPLVFACSLLFLAALGVIGARVGGVGILRPTIRVMFWGALAMAVTAGIGAAVSTVV
jgi:VIT1/CCC1 family predicted Fe2+/Mn2+ transporter